MQEGNDMLCISRIRRHYDTLSAKERCIADYILENGNKVAKMTVAEIAAEADASQATVVRFCRSLGFKGLAEFKLYLGNASLSKEADCSDLSTDESEMAIAQKTAVIYKGLIDETLAVLDSDSLKAAVKALDEASQIVMFGEGGSGCTTRIAYDTFSQIALPCVYVEDPFFQITAASRMEPGQVAFTICHSGRSRDLIENVQVAKTKGATAVSIIGIVGTVLSKISDITLYTGLSDHAFFSETIAARICELNVVSALHSALAVKNQDKLGDYQYTVSELLETKRLKR